MRRSVFATLALIALSPPGGIAQTPAAASFDFPPDSTIRARLAGRVDNGYAASIVIGMLEHGTERYASYGRSNFDDTPKVDPDAIYEIGSITKVFTNILLADEINRASPRTQSALLEAMGESQVSMDGERRVLPDLFFVIATQNPIEFRGTYPLPEAQMDRFALQFGLGYVAPQQEVAILSAQETEHPIERLEPCVTAADVQALRHAARSVRMSEELKRYIVDLAAATRTAPGVQLGASPRASLALMKTAQALAVFDGQEFVAPEQIQELAVDVIAHRLVMEPQAKFSGLTARAVVEDVLKKLRVPA